MAAAKIVGQGPGRKKVANIEDAYPVAYSAEVTASVLVYEKYSAGWTQGKVLLESELKQNFPAYLDLAITKYYPGGWVAGTHRSAGVIYKWDSERAKVVRPKSTEFAIFDLHAKAVKDAKTVYMPAYVDLFGIDHAMPTGTGQRQELLEKLLDSLWERECSAKSATVTIERRYQALPRVTPE